METWVLLHWAGIPWVSILHHKLEFLNGKKSWRHTAAQDSPHRYKGRLISLCLKSSTRRRQRKLFSLQFTGPASITGYSINTTRSLVPTPENSIYGPQRSRHCRKYDTVLWNPPGLYGSLSVIHDIFGATFHSLSAAYRWTPAKSGFRVIQKFALKIASLRSAIKTQKQIGLLFS
jgi:hypothetical protein